MQNRSGIYKQHPKDGGSQPISETRILAPFVYAQSHRDHLPEVVFDATYSDGTGGSWTERVVIGLSKPGLVALHRAVGEILDAQLDNRP